MESECRNANESIFLSRSLTSFSSSRILQLLKTDKDLEQNWKIFLYIILELYI